MSGSYSNDFEGSHDYSEDFDSVTQVDSIAVASAASGRAMSSRRVGANSGSYVMASVREEESDSHNTPRGEVEEDDLGYSMSFEEASVANGLQPTKKGKAKVTDMTDQDEIGEASMNYSMDFEADNVKSVKQSRSHSMRNSFTEEIIEFEDSQSKDIEEDFLEESVA